MATERKNGAGLRLSGVLERAATPPEPPSPARAEDPDQPAEAIDRDQDQAESMTRGRGGPARKSRTLAARAARRVKGRTVYMADDLFERLLVQSHRRGMTISDYVCSILDRSVPDHLHAGRVDQDRESAQGKTIEAAPAR